MGRFTAGRVPASPIAALFSREARWQCWLDVEAALATAEAEVGIVPAESAVAIVTVSKLECLDLDRVRAEVAATSHPLMPLVNELARAAGEPHGGWVHWGATTQNITQTGDTVVLREVHHVLLGMIGELLVAMATLAEHTASLPTAGRTHGQHAVPISFGLKVAGWIDEFTRHVDRLRAVEDRVFTAMLGGAVGNFASLGELGPVVQQGVATQLGLRSIPIASRAISDSAAEYVCILGLLAGTAARIAGEVYALMRTEIAEVAEPSSDAIVSSSTMPHKHNPQLADDCLAISAEIRAVVPLVLEGMLRDHEVDGAHSDMTDAAIQRSCIGAGDLLSRLLVIISGLELDADRMRTNLAATGGLISSERVMLALGHEVGRQDAHRIVHEDALAAASASTPFLEVLVADPRVTAHLDRATIARLLEPESDIGLSEQIAREAAGRARAFAAHIA